MGLRALLMMSGLGAALALAGSLALAGCSDVTGQADAGWTNNTRAVNTVGPEGVWTLTSLSIDGSEVSGAGLSLDIDLLHSSLQGETLCHRIFGSFTFTDASSDNTVSTASFTVPGRSESDCDPESQLLEDQTVFALETVTQWEQTEDRLVLWESDQIRLEFQAG